MMTVEQVLIETQKLLRGINIPVELIEQIGFPIKSAINSLQMCLDAFNEQKKEDGEAQEQEEESNIISIEEIGAKENE